MQRKSGSLLCIGLDTDIARIPKNLARGSDPVADFNRRIIDATSDLVCAYKLNLAFYEAGGERGLRSLQKTLAHIPDGIITIGDGKRGDIRNTSELYARALFVELGFDACTVSPYMGRDSVEPFLRNRAKGVFVLAMTSNPGAEDFQHLRIAGRPLHEHVMESVVKWNTRQNCGLVVGATRPRQLERARMIAPDMPFLIPGVGAQGGDTKASVRHGCDRHGEMAIMNAGRSIIYASSGRDFARAARASATRLHEEICTYRRRFFDRDPADG